MKLTERESYASVIDRLMERAARAQVLELKVKELEDKIKIE
jgi:hypothetical protein